jgi:7,8-dihydro-6-hydroxymethylpterin-pyrophosphokinase
VDIDILIFEEQLVEKDILTIPHKRLKERAFVLVPLAELAPELILPEQSETIEDLLQSVDRSGVTLYVE